MSEARADNVLIVTTDAGKGAGGVLGAMRLHDGLVRAGVRSRILARRRSVDAPEFAEIEHNTPLERLLGRATGALGLHYVHHYTTFRVPEHPFFREADVVNYHTVHGGYFNYLAFPKLTEKRASVFTVHDMWSFTGHCSFSYDCERWKTGCGRCPYPKTFPEIRRDSTHVEWRLKRWAFQSSQMDIVSPSRWLADRCRESLLGTLRVHHIPNGIDLEVFRPRDRVECRRLLGVPQDKRAILYTSYDLARFVKGGDLLIETIRKLPERLRRDTVLLLMGHNGDAIARKVPVECIDFGFVTGDNLKSLVLSASDLFLFPTRADNLPYSAQEAVACGTPVVTFALGGMPDLARPGVTGALAEPLSTDDLAAKTEALLEDESGLAALRTSCRAVAEAEFGIDLQVERYRALFRRLCEERRSQTS